MKRIVGVKAGIEHFRYVRGIGGALNIKVKASGRSLYDEDLSPLEIAARVIREVRAGGDSALKRISGAIDGAPLAFIEVPPAEVEGALKRISSSAREALETAAKRVRAFQQAAKPKGWSDPSGQFGETITPVDRVGAYVPGGTAPLASTVIMTVVPARVAGVREVILTTPAPGDAMPHPAVLAAAAIAGADRVFKVGGAHAIAAMAYGTETVPKVDLVCGPGNIFVTAAKKLVYGDVGIDGLYGPTETLVVADEWADPEYCAADLIAQAEHDHMAMPVLVATSEAVAERIEAALERRLSKLARQAIARGSVEANGATVIVKSVEDAIELANAMAPEHLCLSVKDPSKYAGLVKSAGGLFLGESSAEVMADYVAGPSHVMPTGGTARFASALSVRHFLRVTPFLNLSEKSFLEIAPKAAELARLEGLGGHAEAAETRLKRMLGE
ncbi:MAG: histidinol dehydrogenase [Dehalococcoidia bacterium]|nr:histidinol dehydrogenase [Dehalococcoidia bacterium]